LQFLKSVDAKFVDDLWNINFSPNTQRILEWSFMVTLIRNKELKPAEKLALSKPALCFIEEFGRQGKATKVIVDFIAYEKSNFDCIL
jgi:hypothetical protein